VSGDGNELYAWQVQEPDGRWSMVGAMIPPTNDLGLPSGAHLPLIHRSLKVVDLMRPFAEAHAAQTGQPLRLARFSLAEVLEGSFT
jgi:hypothetical protein